MTTDEPGKTVGVIQADQFCLKCGYNLHGQVVRRDERLGLFIVQCPECGQHAPAGQGAGVGPAWLSRLSGLLITMWVAGLGTIFGFLGFIMAMITWGHLAMFTSLADVKMIGGVTALMLQESQGNPGDVALLASLVTLSLLAGGLAGMLASVFLWHLRRRTTIALVALLPALAGACVALIWWHEPEAALTRDWANGCIAGYALLQFLGGAAGVYCGRSVARLLLTLMLPPRLRHQAAALWAIDGKEISA